MSGMFLSQINCKEQIYERDLKTERDFKNINQSHCVNLI